MTVITLDGDHDDGNGDVGDHGNDGEDDIIKREREACMRRLPSLISIFMTAPPVSSPIVIILVTILVIHMVMVEMKYN